MAETHMKYGVACADNTPGAVPTAAALAVCPYPQEPLYNTGMTFCTGPNWVGFYCGVPNSGTVDPRCYTADDLRPCNGCCAALLAGKQLQQDDVAWQYIRRGADANLYSLRAGGVIIDASYTLEPVRDTGTTCVVNVTRRHPIVYTSVTELNQTISRYAETLVC